VRRALAGLEQRELVMRLGLFPCRSPGAALVKSDIARWDYQGGEHQRGMKSPASFTRGDGCYQPLPAQIPACAA
jgi:hypothetical protein